MVSFWLMAACQAGLPASGIKLAGENLLNEPLIFLGQKQMHVNTNMLKYPTI